MQILAQDALAFNLQRETIVSFRKLRKDYGANAAVDDFSLEIRRGELVVFSARQVVARQRRSACWPGLFRLHAERS